MADKEKNVNGVNDGGAQEGGQNQTETTEVTVVKQKNWLGTAIKIGGGLLLTAAGIGLGWLLKGIFGGKDDDGESAAAEAESPAE